MCVRPLHRFGGHALRDQDPVETTITGLWENLSHLPIEISKRLHKLMLHDKMTQHVEEIMSSNAIHLTNIAYNAASQSFEALAIVTKSGNKTTFPVTALAPISTDFERAAQLLQRAALKATGQHGLSSVTRIDTPVARLSSYLKSRKRRGLPVGEFGFFRGRQRAA